LSKQRYISLAMWRCIRSCASLDWKRHVTEKFSKYCCFDRDWHEVSFLLGYDVTSLGYWFPAFQGSACVLFQESKMSNNNQEPLDQQCIIISQMNGYLIHTTVKNWKTHRCSYCLILGASEVIMFGISCSNMRKYCR